MSVLSSRYIRCLLVFLALAHLIGCGERGPSQQSESDGRPVQNTVADSFAYPIGKGPLVTQAKDSDEWYNALDFGEENHLGEDWNKNTGGNSDCGEPVYAIANGEITYAADAGISWGNVVIVTHKLSDGTQVQSLYGHLQRITKTSGEVKKRELIGNVGNANGRYLCHLHLELRDQTCLSWDMVFVGYSPIRSGWLDPSDFIDRHR